MMSVCRASTVSRRRQSGCSNLELSFRCRSTVTAHGRNNERSGTLGSDPALFRTESSLRNLHSFWCPYHVSMRCGGAPVHCRFQYQRDVRDAARTSSQRDSLARKVEAKAAELGAHGRGDVCANRAIESLPHERELGHGGHRASAQAVRVSVCGRIAAGKQLQQPARPAAFGGGGGGGGGQGCRAGSIPLRSGVSC
eukprot:SAG31_NODE_2289_length_6000_cov_3.020336_6_plen_196_part_00